MEAHEFAEVEWQRFLPPPADELFAAVEAEFAIKLPAFYIECCRKFHGARVTPHDVCIEGFGTTRLKSFLPLDDHPRRSKLAQLARFMHSNGRIPEQVIPFASEPGGNYFCFDCRVDGEPIVVFWAHEEEQMAHGGLHHVSNSFQEFLAVLE